MRCALLVCLCLSVVSAGEAQLQTELDFGSGEVALGFVDGDSNLDAVFVGAPWRHATCLCDGDGAFSCQSYGVGNAGDVALGFLDADANLDAVFAMHSEPNEVCLGDGTGDFPSCSFVNGDAHVSVAVALGEFGTFDFAIFADGFESGDALAWSATVP